jgi:hypothetical protein
MVAVRNCTNNSWEEQPLYNKRHLGLAAPVSSPQNEHIKGDPTGDRVPPNNGLT